MSASGNRRKVIDDTKLEQTAGRSFHWSADIAKRTTAAAIFIIAQLNDPSTCIGKI